MSKRPMKLVFMAALLTGALAAAAEAQQSGKAVAVDASGAAPSANYTYVACNGGNTVAIRRADGSAVTTLTGIPAPYDVVASPANKRVYVSNSTNPGTVTVIDTDTLVPVVVPFPAGTINLRGMSVSADESSVFIAGQDGAGPAVFRMNTTAPFAPTRIGGIAMAGGAEDCVVIKSAITGGGGNDPGRVFFTVPRAGNAGRIGIINLNPASPVAPIQVGVVGGPLQSVQQADQIERTLDHTAVFVACQKNLGFGTNTQIIRIDAATMTPTVQVVQTGSMDFTANRTWDVTWTTDSVGANRGIVLLQQDFGAKILVELFDTGVVRPVASVPANGGALTDAITVRYDAVANQVFVGDINGTNQGYAFYDASNSPLSGVTAVGAVGNRCQAFAVMPTPAVVVTDICPRAGLSTGPLNVTVHGAGFTAASLVDIGFATIPIGAGLIDSNTFTISLAGAGGSLGLSVNNPQNFQSGQIDTFFRAYNPEVRTAFIVTLPSASQGYKMISLPQYATLTSLKAALAGALGPYNPVLYRVFFYRGGRYVELNGLADDGCDLAGESFWILTRNGGTLSMSEPDVRQNDGGADRVIPLNPGFNMISLPQTNAGGLSGQVPWASLHVTTDPSNFVVGSPGGPPSTTSVQGLAIVDPAVEFVGGGYFVAPNLIAGQGAWVQNISGKPAYLVFQPGLVTKPGPPSFAAGVPPAAGSMPPPPPSGISDGSSGGSGCGFCGLEWLLPLLAVRFVVRRRRLTA